jgi:hypothetical protein
VPSLAPNRCFLYALAYKHTTPGIKKASIRVIRGRKKRFPKGGFLIAPRGVSPIIDNRAKLEGPDAFYSTLSSKVKLMILYNKEGRCASSLPGGQRQHAGGRSSHRGMSGYGGNTQIHYTVVAIEGHIAYTLHGGLERRELKGGTSRRI